MRDPISTIGCVLISVTFTLKLCVFFSLSPVPAVLSVAEHLIVAPMNSAFYNFQLC